MAPREKYLISTLKGLRKHLAMGHNALRKKRIKEGAYIFTLGDISTRFPSKKNAFVDVTIYPVVALTVMNGPVL